jgi:hypothetical protein
MYQAAIGVMCLSTRLFLTWSWEDKERLILIGTLINVDKTDWLVELVYLSLPLESLPYLSNS